MTKSTPLSVRKIAKLTGLSTATVSRALNDHISVSAEAKRKVRKVMEEYGAVGSKPISAPHVIGIIAASTKADYYVSLVRHIIEYFDDRGDSVITYFVDEHNHGGANAFRVMNALHVDGIIAISFQMQEIRTIEEIIIPTVWIDSNRPEDPDIWQVSSNHYIAGRFAANVLLDHGAKCPMIITGQKDSPRGIQRMKGFEEAFNERNLSLPQENIIHTPIIEDPFSEGREAVMYNYTKGLSFDSIFAINDMRAIGAIEACHEIGIQIPEQMKVIAYDGLSLLNSIYKVTSIRQNTALIARTACELLIKKYNKETPEETHVTIPVTLLTGETV